MIWPIYVAYFETVRLITAWCELRQAFRNFRTDRVSALEVLDARFPIPLEKLRRQWMDQEATRPIHGGDLGTGGNPGSSND